MRKLRQRLFPLLLGLLPVLVLADLCATAVAGLVLPIPAHFTIVIALVWIVALAARPHGQKAMFAGAAMFALAGSLLAFWPLGNLKRLHRAAASVDVGMTRTQVAESLGSRLELGDPFPWPNRGPIELWCGNGSGLVECRVGYDASDRVASVQTRFETSRSDFARVVAESRD